MEAAKNQLPDARSPARRITLTEGALWVAICIASAVAAWFLAAPQQSTRPRQDAALFQLLDQNGGQLAGSTLQGKPYLLFFGFVACGDVCPATLQRLSALKSELGDQAKDLKVVFVSSDPGRDTPEALKAYLSNFPQPIIGLTGDFGKVVLAEQQFQVAVEKIPLGGNNYTIGHSPATFLVDKAGQVFTTIRPEDNRDTARQKLLKLIKS